MIHFELHSQFQSQPSTIKTTLKKGSKKITNYAKHNKKTRTVGKKAIKKFYSPDYFLFFSLKKLIVCKKTGEISFAFQWTDFHLCVSNSAAVFSNIFFVKYFSIEMQINEWHSLAVESVDFRFCCEMLWNYFKSLPSKYQ